MFLLDLARRVAGILGAAHGGTGSTYGEERVVVKGLNSTGSTIDLYSVVEYTFATNAPKVRKVSALDSATVLGVLVGYYDGSGLVEDDCPDGYEAAIQTAGDTPVLIESTVTRGELAYAAATDGTAYSSSTAATGAFGRFIDSGDTGQAPTARVNLSSAGAGAGSGGGGGSFGTPGLTYSTTNAAGSASTGIRTDATIALFDATTPADVGDTAATGSAGKAPRRDHVHKLGILTTKGDVISYSTLPVRVGVGSDGQSIVADAAATPGLKWADRTGGFDVVCNAPTAGVAVDIEMPFAGTITSVRIFNDAAGSIVYDLWKDTYANYPPTVADTITASAKPTTSSANKYQDSTLTGWTTSFSAGDIIRVNIDSTSGLGRSVLSVRYKKAA